MGGRVPPSQDWGPPHQNWHTPERTWDQWPWKEPDTGVPQKRPGTSDLGKSLGLGYPQLWTDWKHYLPHPSDAGSNNQKLPNSFFTLLIFWGCPFWVHLGIEENHLMLKCYWRTPHKTICGHAKKGLSGTKHFYSVQPPCETAYRHYLLEREIHCDYTIDIGISFIMLVMLFFKRWNLQLYIPSST